MRRLAALAAVLWMGACGDEPEDDDLVPPRTVPNVDDDDDDVTTGDTGGYVEPPCSGTLAPDIFWLRTSFAYDEENEQFAIYAVPGAGLAPITYRITLIDSFQGAGCDVFLVYDRRTGNADWVDKQSAWASMELPDDVDVLNFCDGCRLEPSNWTDGEPGESGLIYHLTKWDWGFGVGPLDEETEANVQASQGTGWAAIEPFLVGGHFYSNAFAGSELSEDGHVGIGTAFGFQVDGNFQIDVDGAGNAKPIDKDLINKPGGIATGYYETELILGNPVALTRPVP